MQRSREANGNKCRRASIQQISMSDCKTRNRLLMDFLVNRRRKDDCGEAADFHLACKVSAVVKLGLVAQLSCARGNPPGDFARLAFSCAVDDQYSHRALQPR